MDFKFIFIIWPIILIGLIGWVINSQKSLNKTTGFIWFLLVALIIISFARRITRKIELDREDVYGEYVIDTTHFYGPQAKWQYNHYRFEIKRNNKIVFFLTDKNKIIHSYT